jgi:asparagine synthase (glutamine-hydrolysing)
MCGINGLVQSKMRQPEKYVEKMNSWLTHRGPDATGILSGSGYTFGHKRLAIVDSRNHDADQPMAYEDFVIAYNGEIYNFRKLRQELRKIGYKFKTNCDTEVLLKAYKEWGIHFLDKISGQFAFAIINTATHEVLLVRDRTGKKPLYYSFIDGELRFSSLPEALCIDQPFKPDEFSIASALLHRVSFVHGEEPLGRSYYKNIFQVYAGEYILLKNGQLSQHKYYTLPLADSPEDPSIDQCILDVRNAMTEAIKQRIPQEVSMGIALSGGLDSSVIAAIAAKNYQRQIYASCITYTLQKDNSDYEHAKLLANRYSNIELLAAEITPENFLADLEEFVDVMGPHDSISELAMFRNYKTLKEHGAKVILIGEGADELHWGYWFTYPGLFKDQDISKTSQALFAHVYSRADYVEYLMSKNALASIDFDTLSSYIPNIYHSFSTRDVKRKMMGVYATVQLEFLNRANDRLGMCCSLEPRCPYQDIDAIRAACAVPRKYQLTNDTEKFVLREAFKDVLPPQILHRRKSPLPPASHIEYHMTIARHYKEWLEKTDNAFWLLFNKEAFYHIYEIFTDRISTLDPSETNAEASGVSLVQRRTMHTRFNFLTGEEIRTNDVFQLLTMMVWFTRRNNAVVKNC